MAKKQRPAKPRVIVTRRLPPNVEARMAQLFDASFNIGDVAMSHADLAASAASCAARAASAARAGEGSRA